MTIKKAIDRFKWRLTNGWSVNQNDLEAFNSIVKFVNDKHAQQINNHQLFAKLYITYYGELLKYYKATVFDKEPQKELHKQLDKPIHQIIEEFIATATEVEQSLNMEVNGVLTHPRNWTKKHRDSIEILDPVMTFKEAKDNLTSLINLSINKYNT